MSTLQEIIDAQAADIYRLEAHIRTAVAALKELRDRPKSASYEAVDERLEEIVGSLESQLDD